MLFNRSLVKSMDAFTQNTHTQAEFHTYKPCFITQNHIRDLTIMFVFGQKTKQVRSVTLHLNNFGSGRLALALIYNSCLQVLLEKNKNKNKNPVF